MKYGKTLCLLLSGIMSIACSDLIYAQKNKNIESSVWTVGTEISSNFNYFSQDITAKYPYSLLDIAKSSSGSSPYISVFVDKRINNSWHLNFGLGADWKSFNDNGRGTYIEQSGISNEPFTNSFMEYKGSFFNLDAFIKADFFITKNLFVSVGPVVSVGFGNMETSTTVTHIYQGMNYCDIDTTENSSVKVRIGGEASVGFKFYAGKNIWLSPVITYQFFPMNITDDIIKRSGDAYNVSYDYVFENRRLQTLRLGCKVWFDFLNMRK